jgi:REP element-mobilizing transposase RayT
MIPAAQNGKDSQMNHPRLKVASGAYYHLVSRCCLKQFLFEDTEKKVFVAMMRRVAAFAGIEILTHCIMSNHFHILVRAPEPRLIPEAELLTRVAILYGDARAKEMRERWATYRQSGLQPLLDKEQAQLRRRMGDISEFMHDLKLRFSCWYRANHSNHEGTLWQSCFGSTLVEGNGSLAAVAAYIDLNPVRAGLVTDPKDYPYSGFAAALTGDSDAIRGLTAVYGNITTDFGKVLAAYRGLLYTKAKALAPLSSPPTANEQSSLLLLLRTKIRAMSKGLAIGSREFTVSIFTNHRMVFSEKRKHPPRGTPLCPAWDGIQLCSVRHLRPPKKSSIA